MGLPALFLSAVAIFLTAYNEGRRLGRRDEAERAALPLVLSEINGYATSAKEKVEPLFTNLEDDALNKEGLSFTPPKLPDGISSRLKGAIEASGAKAVRRRLSDTVTTVQLVAARLDGLALDIERPSPLVLRANLQEMILDIAALHAIIGSMYKYSRRQSAWVDRYDYDALRSSLRQLYFFDENGAREGLFGQEVAEMLSTLDRREKAGISPYNFDSKVRPILLSPKRIAGFLRRSGDKVKP